MKAPNSTGLRWRKLPARFHAVVLPLVLSLLMSGIVSAISTLKGVGFVDDVVPRWLEAWFVSWLVAFPTLLLILPLVRRIVAGIVEAPGR